MTENKNTGRVSINANRQRSSAQWLLFYPPPVPQALGLHGVSMVNPRVSSHRHGNLWIQAPFQSAPAFGKERKNKS